MDSRKIVFTQTGIVAAGVLIGVAAMIGIFALLGMFDSTVLLGGGVGGISELLGGLQDFLFGFWADTRFAAERAVDGTGRNAGRLGNIIDRYSFFFHDALRFYYCIKFFQ